MAHFHLAAAHLRRGLSDAAAVEYRAALARDPGNVPSLTGLAQLDLDAGRPAEALPLLERAAALEPRHPWVRDRLGVTLVLVGRGGEGLAALRAAAALAPWDAAIHGDLAQAEEWLGGSPPPPGKSPGSGPPQAQRGTD